MDQHDAVAREARLTAIAKRDIDNTLQHATTRPELLQRLRDRADFLEQEILGDCALRRLRERSVA